MKVLQVLAVPVFLAGVLLAGGSDKSEKESNALGTVRSINTAQATYRQQYGFWACDIGQLLPGPTGSKPSPDQAGLLDGSVTDAKARGYDFMVMCPKDRSQGYETVAWPKDKKMRTFCSDNSTLLFFADGDPNKCLQGRKPIS
jgi:type II secretory pathway pseudopilin PulG